MDRAIVIRPDFPRGRRIIAVSDIHGNLPFFQALLRKIRLTPQDILVLDGDILEKGGDSLALLRRVMELSRTHTVYPICGNCDGLVLRFFETDALDERFFSFYLPQHPESTLRQLAREGRLDPGLGREREIARIIQAHNQRGREGDKLAQRANIRPREREKK